MGRFKDSELEQRCVRLAAWRFGQLQKEDLARLPPRVVMGLLSQDGLRVVSEARDEVYRAVAGYIEARDWADGAGGGQLCEEELQVLCLRDVAARRSGKNR